MYHIPNDRRALRSAGRIYDALMRCLEHMKFSDISISDLERCGISRATFYRLFGNLSDVLEWKCEIMMCDAIGRAGDSKSGSFSDVLLSFIASIAENQTLISTLAANSKTYILYDLHMHHMQEIEKIFFYGIKLDDIDRCCITSILSSLIPSLCTLSLKYPDKSSEELLSNLKKALSRIDKALEYENRGL